MSGNLDAALEYAGSGLLVFPCHFIRDNGCSCGKADCSSPGKHPIPRDGCLSATTDTDQITQWWTVNANANVAVATGPESGVFVIDADGDQGIADIGQLQLGDIDFGLPLVADTGGAGRHYFYRYPSGTTISNGTRLHGLAVDVRGAGGYVVVSPSNHVSGGEYRWRHGFDADLIPEAPPGLLDWIASAKSNGSGKSLVMQGDLDTAPGVAKGKRHDTLVEYVGRHLAYGEAGTVTLQKALVWGRKCSPPLDDQEVIKVVTDIEQRHRSRKQDNQQTADAKDKPRKSQAKVLVELAVGTELFHDSEQTGYASFDQNGHVETWPIRSRAFRQWLCRRFWIQCQGAPSAQAIQDATNVLHGCALFDGPEHSVSLRVAFGDARAHPH